MKKLFTILFIFLSILLNAQIDTPPSGVNFKTLPTYTFKWYTPDSTLWMYKGSTYNWTNLSKAQDLRLYRLLTNHDSLSTLQEKSYNSLNDLPDLTLKANVDNPTFTTKITTPALNIPTSAAINYFWKCTDAGTGAGIWSAVAVSQVYKGTWNATTNTPTLADGGGTAGWYYRCTVAGTVDFGSGNITFSIGDDVYYNGTIWQRVPGGTSQWTTTGSDIYYNSGNVGIGTMSPLGKLHVFHAAGSEFFTVDNTDGIILVNKIASKSIGLSASQNGTYGGNGSAGIKINEGGGVAGAGSIIFVNDGDAKVILKNGNVGIGTATPGTLLSLNSVAGNHLISFTKANTPYGYIGLTQANNYITGASNNDIVYRSENTNQVFSTDQGGTVQMMLKTGGNVGIGTTSPATVLEVNGIITATSGNSTQWNTAYTHSQIAGGTGVHISDAERTTWNAKEPALGNPGTSGFVLSSTTGGARSWVAQQSIINGTGFVKASGTTISYDNSTYITGTPWTSPFTNSGAITATNFILSSDKRLKEHIKPIKNTFDIKFVQFNLKSDPDQLRYGVLAQDVEERYPELVRTDSKGMKSVAYIDLLIGKINELELRIKELERANDIRSERERFMINKIRNEK